MCGAVPPPCHMFHGMIPFMLSGSLCSAKPWMLNTQKYGDFTQKTWSESSNNVQKCVKYCGGF
jgi:hypothetical protein